MTFSPVTLSAVSACILHLSCTPETGRAFSLTLPPQRNQAVAAVFCVFWGQSKVVSN